MALLGWNSPGAQPGPALSTGHAPSPQPGWAPALGQAWGFTADCFRPPVINPIPLSGREPRGLGPLPSPSGTCYSETPKTPAQRRARKSSLRRGGEGWGPGGSVCQELTSPASWHRPPRQRLQLRWGSGCCFCRVILSCPEESWPKATFLWGLSATEHGNLLSHQPRRSPARLAGWSLSSLCRQQHSPPRPWVPSPPSVPAHPGP